MISLILLFLLISPGNFVQGYELDHEAEKTRLRIIAYVPMLHKSETVVPSHSYAWQRGWETICGAQIAVEMINKDASLLPNNTLELVPVDSLLCDDYDSLATFLELVLQDKSRNNIVGMIGLFCPLEFQIITRLASRFGISVQISGSSSPVAFSEAGIIPGLYHLVQSDSEKTRALLQFMERHDWTCLGVITDSTDTLYLNTATLIRKLARQCTHDITVKDFVVNRYHDNIIDAITTVGGTRINLISTSLVNSLKILCEAYLRNLSWPDHLWIVMDHQNKDFISAMSQSGLECRTEKILDGVIFIEEQLEPEDHTEHLAFGLTYKELVNLYSNSCSFGVNPYVNILYDAVGVVALAANARMRHGNEVSFNGASGRVEFSQEEKNKIRVNSRVLIYQVLNGSKESLAMYKNRSIVFTNPNKLVFMIPGCSNPESKTLRSPITSVILNMDTMIWFVIVTVILILFCCFRKKASIKSTSLPLSMLMFAGCYLMLLYVTISDSYYLPQYANLSPRYKEFECVVRIWLHGLGLPSGLILATLIVRVTRVYYIFLSPAKLKFVSNGALCVYIIIIMLPNFAVLAAWTADVAREGNSTVSGLATCKSSNLFLWLYFLIPYSVGLILTLIVVAVLTRNIRYSNFKDTKKVNALVFVLVYTYSFTLSYWMILQSIERGENYIGRFILHAGHILIVAECQLGLGQ